MAHITQGCSSQELSHIWTDALVLFGTFHSYPYLRGLDPVSWVPNCIDFIDRTNNDQQEQAARLITRLIDDAKRRERYTFDLLSRFAPWQNRYLIASAFGFGPREPISEAYMVVQHITDIQGQSDARRLVLFAQAVGKNVTNLFDRRARLGGILGLDISDRGVSTSTFQWLS